MSVSLAVISQVSISNVAGSALLALLTLGYSSAYTLTIVLSMMGSPLSMDILFPSNMPTLFVTHFQFPPLYADDDDTFLLSLITYTNTS